MPSEYNWRTVVPQRTQEIRELLSMIRFKYPLLGEIMNIFKESDHCPKEYKKSTPFFFLPFKTGN